jgi:hypothetical protein
VGVGSSLFSRSWVGAVTVHKRRRRVRISRNFKESELLAIVQASSA